MYSLFLCYFCLLFWALWILCIEWFIKYLIIKDVYKAQAQNLLQLIAAIKAYCRIIFKPGANVAHYVISRSKKSSARISEEAHRAQSSGTKCTITHWPKCKQNRIVALIRVCTPRTCARSSTTSDSFATYGGDTRMCYDWLISLIDWLIDWYILVQKSTTLHILTYNNNRTFVSLQWSSGYYRR